MKVRIAKQKSKTNKINYLAANPYPFRALSAIAAIYIGRELIHSPSSTLPKIDRRRRRLAGDQAGEKKNAVLHRSPAAGAARHGHGHGHRLLGLPHGRRGWAARVGGGGSGSRGAELRLDPEAGALQLEPQRPRRVPQAGEASRPAHQRPDHR